MTGLDSSPPTHMDECCHTAQGIKGRGTVIVSPCRYQCVNRQTAKLTDRFITISRVSPCTVLLTQQYYNTSPDLLSKIYNMRTAFVGNSS